jgi:hypothetical protein
MRPALRTILALGLGLWLQGLAQGAVAQQRQPEVAPCRVRQGDRGAPGDRSVVVGNATLGACMRTILAGSGTGTWGPYEIEVGADGQVHINGEAVGVLRKPDGADEDRKGR